jgi:lipoprotein-releasing system ATP-binding protein
MSQRATILSARGVFKEFKTAEKTLPVLKGVDLELTTGEVVAVTGASGVGKSTLLHILGGLDRPTRGEITILDTTIHAQPEKALARFRNRKIGFVFQFHYLLDDFSALENVMIPLILADTPAAEARRRAELLLAQVGLEDRTSHRPKQLSGWRTTEGGGRTRAGQPAGYSISR